MTQFVQTAAGCQSGWLAQASVAGTRVLEVDLGASPASPQPGHGPCRTDRRFLISR
jgi:hypothetical protein